MESTGEEQIERFEKERKEILSGYKGWLYNIPFYLVSVELVLSFRGASFTPIEFYQSKLWTDPSHWNAALVKDGTIVIFIYGTWQRLEKYLYVERIAALPSEQSYGNKLWKMCIDICEDYAREKGCEAIWTVTPRKGEVKKMLESGVGLVLNPPKMMVLHKRLVQEVEK